jgi:choline dehydrogenase-like flavoprotein
MTNAAMSLAAPVATKPRTRVNWTPAERADDASAVVDSTVHGIEALRVVDASIFPAIPRRHIHFIVLMAAETIADAIKSEWRCTNICVNQGVANASGA